MIEGNIKKLIHKYGHTNCGLRHIELCEEIKKIIYDNKQIVFQHMDPPSKKEWSTKWDSQRNGFFNKLFDKEGFINMCYPFKKIVHQDLYQLQSRHVKFCKEKEVWRASVEKNNEYNECVRYNSWINGETTSFTLEYLRNVKEYNLPIVKKYFAIKEHPGGHDPLGTYRKSKLDCEKYDPKSERYQQMSVTKIPPDSAHTPISHDVKQESQGESVISVPDEGGIEKTKSHAKDHPQNEPSPSHSLTSSITKTEVDATANIKQPISVPENIPIKSTNSHGTTNDQQDTNMVILQGTPVPPSTAVSMAQPDNEIQINVSNYKELLGNIVAYKISHDVHHSINRKYQKIHNYYPTNIKGEVIRPSIEKSYNYIPSQLRKQGFLPHFFKQGYIPQISRSEPFPKSIPYSQPTPITFSRAKNYNPITQPTKYHTPLLREYPPFPIITSASGTNEIETILIQPAIPDPSYFRSPFMIYTLIFLTIVAIITIFYFLCKYTPFGLLFGKKRKKQRLKRHLKTNKLPEEVPQFDTIDSYSINNMSYENKTHYNKDINSHIQIQKSIINKNISLPKRKKKKRKAIIDIHMEMLNECKNDEWGLNKNDFLEICLEEFIREQKKIYASSEHTNLIMKSISTKNTKGDIVFRWDKWAKRYTHIWEYFKRENTFKILQNQWKEEEKAYFDKIQTHNSNFNENEKFALIETKKDIWKKWMTKQATLMDQYKEEQWFKSLVEELENVSDEYKKEKIKDDIFVENIKELENEENNEELYKLDKHIFQIKVLIQILMMVIEECIKEENPEQTEMLLDNLINKLNKEKRAKIEPENIYEENMNHIRYNEMLE
ncbi:STP1 protein [Plasmodium ovale wallikeri]|uniref:STP1 protein n=1 Tax=Plasmodium ovale wallikeri TaxID=864142 RepID=A0A1A9AJZ9_PLAOA|nr:STP1 protein [Plasmodium ovale wallikeri]